VLKTQRGSPGSPCCQIHPLEAVIGHATACIVGTSLRIPQGAARGKPLCAILAGANWIAHACRPIPLFKTPKRQPSAAFADSGFLSYIEIGCRLCLAAGAVRDGNMDGPRAKTLTGVHELSTDGSRISPRCERVRRPSLGAVSRSANRCWTVADLRVAGLLTRRASVHPSARGTQTCTRGQTWMHFPANVSRPSTVLLFEAQAPPPRLPWLWRRRCDGVTG
jgi:hypothetical protein